MGPRARERARIRERRRRVLTFLVEATGITFLIGLFPPLRGMWMIAGILGLALGAYVFMLIQLKAIEQGRGSRRLATPADPGQQRYRAVAQAGSYDRGTRYVAEAGSRSARVSYAGLTAAADEEELVHVVVRGEARA